MISKVLDRISFASIFLVITLLPVFFLPYAKIPVETSKSLLLIIGLAVAIVFWTMARFFDGRVSVPRSILLMSGLGIVLSFILSSFFSPSVKSSMFGMMFDIGTFWFMFASFLLMMVASLVVRNARQARNIFYGFVIVSTILIIFQFIHLAFPTLTSFGVLPANVDNLLGSWSALGIFAGLLSVVSLFFVEFFTISRREKIFLSILLLISLAFTAIVNFVLVWILLGIFSLVIFVFKILAYSHLKQVSESEAHFPVLPLVVMIVSILFLMSGSLVRDFLPSTFGISSAEISPSLKTTILVAKDTIVKSPIFGAGPNRFKEMWAMYKPASINTTQFWNTDFDFGSGMIPTFAVTTGILGIIMWIIFLFIFVKAGLRSVFATIKDRVNPEMSAFFLASFYLFIAAFFYPVGSVMFLLAFAFAGVFVGLSTMGVPGGEISLSFLGDHKKSFFSIIFLVLIMIASVIASVKFLERFVSVSYFSKTLSAPTIPVAESAVIKAITLNPNDLYYRTYAQVYLVKLNSQLSSDQASTEETKATLQATLDRAIAGARSASEYDPTNYINFRALGIVYDSLANMGVPDASEKAIENYKKATELNPLNPGLKLSIARAHLSSGNTKDARLNAEQALTLKPNYIEGLVVLSQIATREGNSAQALLYAEQALALSPADKNLIDYVNSLK